MRWNKKIIQILLLALPVACVFTSQTTGTNMPQTANTSAPQTGKSFSLSISTGGATRDAWVHIPAGYASAKTAPLIVNFHGLGSTGKDQEAQTGMSALADQKGFLVAYPDGVAQNGKQQWNTDHGSPDVQFIGDLVQKLQADYKVDPKRIYATGMSNGGGMTNRVGCDLANIFAAIAPVEGGYADPGWKGLQSFAYAPVHAGYGVPWPY